MHAIFIIKSKLLIDDLTVKIKTTACSFSSAGDVNSESLEVVSSRWDQLHPNQRGTLYAVILNK
jgi:hypothetical protein